MSFVSCPRQQAGWRRNMGAEEGGNLTIGTRGRGTEREEIMGVGKLREEDREMRTWERRTGE